MVDLNPENAKFDKSLFIFLDSNTKAKYFKVKYIPTEDGLEEYWSDFIEIPQDATIDGPKYFILDCPNGYRWNNYERFDENKEVIE